MRGKYPILTALAALLLVAGAALAQVPTGSIAGHVVDANGSMPGVTVTATSAHLQGARSATTTEAGDFMFPFLPPGEYLVKFELAGYQTVEATIKVTAAQTAKLDAEMALVKLSEEITVTGRYETISAASAAASTVEQSVLEQLPVQRDLYRAVNLAPGVHATGPRSGGTRDSNITISGAQSYESLFLINGVVVNENLRGQATNLFIEDAIQETTTMTSGVSAEYGRFAGGVVNMLTKSGGNEFSGSLRANLENDSWVEATPVTVSRTDKVNETFEVTLGGKLLQDKLWFFAAARDRGISEQRQTTGTNISMPYGEDELRYEGKLTYSLTPEHRLIASYSERNRDWTNYYYSSYPPVDRAQFYDRSIPETLLSLNYTGVLSDNLFLEGQYSQRELTFVGSGSRYTDMIQGTPVIERSNLYIGNSPLFCAVCGQETRDNEDILLKGTYFLSTTSAGSHDIVFGVDRFTDMVKNDNHQSGSDWQVRVPSFIFQGEDWYPRIPGGPASTSVQLWWRPIPIYSQGTEFTTDSVFVNDRWRLNDRLSFNVGLRYDKNDGVDANGSKVSDDSRLSPRLGVTWDTRGDGDLVVNASYGNYVTALAGTGNVANASPAGNPSLMGWYYRGPGINTGSEPYVSGADALQQIWDWFFNDYCDAEGNCGTENIGAIYTTRFTGYNRIIEDSLASPYAEEYSLGAVKRFGSSTMVRLDAVHREFKDLYLTHLDMGTGKVEVIAFDQNWGMQDLGFIENSDYLKREYDGVSLQAQYRHDRWNVGGNYTWSKAWGNFDGETSGAGPITSTANPYYYPEYFEDRWANPEGYLNIDQRHKARAWVVWDAFNTAHHRLSLSLLESYYSGTPYGALGLVRAARYVTNPGYTTPPTTTQYYYTPRDAYRTDDVTSTDIGLNYSFKFRALGTDLELFIQPEVENVFNEQAVTNPNLGVEDRGTGYNTYADFNPFTETPVEGVHWAKGPLFGQADDPFDYQQPRTFRVSIGFRF